tara:strand:- start:262 stop:1599 length:1338 start_codon:yes stop_codon:yes gene_type:complete
MFESKVVQVLNKGLSSTQYIVGVNGESQFASGAKHHRHDYYVDDNGNGVAYKAVSPDNPNIFHQHEIVNWVVQEAKSVCYPNCKEQYGSPGVGPHTHLLQQEEKEISHINAADKRAPQATHMLDTLEAGGIALYNLPTLSTNRAIMGYLNSGTNVQVVREWVNKDFAEIKMVDPGPNNEYTSFQRPGIKDRFFYVRKKYLIPFSDIKPRLLQKLYVTPEKMSDLERIAIPNWVKNGMVPYYHRGEAEYWVTVKLPYTCTGEVEMEDLKKEALLKGNEQLFKYYNVYYDEKVIQDFTNGFLSSYVHDYHLESRPGSKLKMLVKVRALYFDWLRKFGGKLKSVEMKDLPPAAKTLVLNPKRYETELEKMSKLMAKLHMDMYQEGVAVPGVNLMKNAQKLQKFSPSLRKLLIANGIDPDNTEQNEYEIVIGYSEDMKPLYVVARNVNN